MFKIEIGNMGKGTRSHILASCKVKLTSEDGVEFVSIFDARVMRNRNGQLWVAWPSQYLRDLDQSERYVPILVFSDKLERRIADAVLTGYEGYRTMSPRAGCSVADNALEAPVPTKELPLDNEAKESRSVTRFKTGVRA